MIPPLKKIKNYKILSIVILLIIIIPAIFFIVKGADEPRENIHADLPEISEPEKEECFENPSLIIEKINVNVPVVLDVDGSDRDTYNKMLEGGVAHMLGTACPGSNGNVVIFGHSSADWQYEGDFGEIFRDLNDLEVEDIVIISNKKSKNINYKLVEKSVVEEDNTSVLDQSLQNKLTLLTCWPIGTSDKRLVLVFDKI